MISIIAAIQRKDRGLGFQNKLLFRISDDLKNFKNLTEGNVVIMGRKTFESIGKPLPNRENIVITRNENFKPEGVSVVHSLDEALELALSFKKEIFIIGGGEIYQQALPRTDRLYLTVIDGDLPADTFFPDYSEFKKVRERRVSIDSTRRDFAKSEKNNLSYEYQILEK